MHVRNIRYVEGSYGFINRQGELLGGITLTPTSLEITRYGELEGNLPNALKNLLEEAKSKPYAKQSYRRPITFEDEDSPAGDGLELNE